MKPKGKNELVMHYPSSWWGAGWREALPSGNGKIGAAVYGHVREETVLLTHEDLWSGGLTLELPDISKKLPEARGLLLAGDAVQANRILPNTLEQLGYQPKLSWPLPLCDLKVRMPSQYGFKQYERRLDMETGEVTVTWKDGETRYERSLFVSRPADLIVYEIRAIEGEPLHVEFGMGLHDLKDMRKPTTVLPDHLQTYIDGEYLFFAATNDDKTDFGAVAKVDSKGGTLEEVNGMLRVCGGESLLLTIQLFVKEERSAAWERIRSELKDLNTGYAELLLEHAQEHGRLFHAMRLELEEAEGPRRSNEELLLEAYRGETPLEMMEKMWAYGRYLLISSSREGGHPCHLYGLWCGEYEGMWAFNMVNENLQMIYWQSLSGNMPELLLTVFDYMERLMDDFRTNAYCLYGCRGIYIPAPTAPDSGLLKHRMPHILHWTGGAGWVAQHYYDYYLYTGDEAFLRSRALPFLRETALFYEDFFIVGEDGYYISCPSISPENAPGNYRSGPMDKPLTETTVNATMDFAIAKEVLRHLIDGAQAIGAYSAEIDKWKSMLERIPPYCRNEDGSVKEWMHPYFTDYDHHRHQSHIYPVFPGTEVTRESDPELYEAFMAAAKKRLAIGLGEQTGWSLAHMANHYARMGEGDLALECLELLSRSCVMNNFFTLHNDWRKMGIGLDKDWAPFQIDANMGWSAAVQEMLLFSLPGQLHILPALPARWRKGKAGPMLARGAVEVTVAWNRDTGSVQLELMSRSRSQTVEVVLPQPVQCLNGRELQKQRCLQLCLEAGEAVQLSFAFVGDALEHSCGGGDSQ
ncbi:glycosyl hydrolase family 95 catalytic domain-containing protein [Paenibacillus rigui]|uniref:Alpha-L-fucosidase n=1 Tax=Paenibacillus rigui TaxID=554312 RepID=A0A229UPJ2_9BACL|nr:glycoside hydrolase N-terminal domain-containing protein [Paenibacillus rigui]OXM85406.1 alpha-L-fucosidase [Paenibacillus rigui]